MKFIKKHIDSIKILCSHHTVNELYLIDHKPLNESPGKEIVFLVEFAKFQPEAYADNYFSFKHALEGLLEKKIILVEANAVKNPFLKKHYDNAKKLIYGQQDKGLAV